VVSLAPAALAAGGFTDLEFGLTLWTVVLFAIFAFVLTKLGWKPLLAMIEEREKGIHEAVGSAQKANEEAQRLLAQHQELIREAGRQREEIMKRALADAETVKNDVIAQARKKLRAKGVDLVVANDVSRADAGFEVDTNEVTLVSADGDETLPLQSKTAIAERVLDRIETMLRARTPALK